MYIFKEPSENSFEKVGITGKVFPLESLTSKTEVVFIETEVGHETVIRQKESDFLYYILEGNGIFTIDDKNYFCEKGNLVVVPAGKKFTYKGKLKMLLCITPPWKEDQEEILS